MEKIGGAVKANRMLSVILSRAKNNEVVKCQWQGLGRVFGVVKNGLSV